MAILFAAAFTFSAMEVRADYELSEHELALLELINQARANPGAAIYSAGLDPDAVFENIPSLRHFLETGMKPFVFHPRLQAAAQKHTRDMFQHNHFGIVLPDGLPPEDKVLGQGYPAIDAGLSLGNVVFQNFIAPEDAVWKIFKAMLLEELNSGDEKNLVLLNPDHNEMGISLIAGEMVFEGQTRNVYLSSCFSGYSLGGQVSELLLEMINMLRNRPDYDIQEPEDDTQEPDSEFLIPEEEVKSLNLRGMPPLAQQAELISAGLTHVFDMEKKLYYDPVSPEGESPIDRVSRFGYEAEEISNALAFVEIQENRSSLHYASALFDQLVLQEFLSTNGFEHILDRRFSEAGVAVGLITVEISPETQTNFLILSAYFTNPVSSRMFAVGGVYTALIDDAGGEYWKGVQNLNVELASLVGDNVVESSRTGRMGLFQIPILPGMYKINLLDNDRVIASKPLIMPQENVYVNFWLKEPDFNE